MHSVYYIMGVSGCGKSTIGKLLNERIQFPFWDGDDFHPQANIDKMSNGFPLDDEDRRGWLNAIKNHADEQLLSSSLIIACSALKQKYRDQLSNLHNGKAVFIYLYGNFDLIAKRMENRKDHFMPPHLLKSQFNALEEPEKAWNYSIELDPQLIVQSIIKKINLIKMSEFGLIGLGVMGKSLARNLARKGFSLSVFNRHVDGKEEKIAAHFIKEFPELNNTKGFDDLGQFVHSLEQPRKIFLMVNAGKPVDAVIQELKPLLGQGDVIIDGGNSNYKETQRRHDNLLAEGLEFIGTGVSGGELGALNGPSIMPGGSATGYKKVKPYLEKIAAKDGYGKDCCTFIGKGGSGHFVKMVHNGIEYAEMQLLAETYALMRFAQGKSMEEIARFFKDWNKGECKSYLLEITADILTKKEGEKYLLDLILDKAGNKGTGSWTTIAACELGVPIPTITSALYARYISFFKSLRDSIAKIKDTSNSLKVDVPHEDIRRAYQASRIINHHQGFHLIKNASEKYDWEINFSELARIWTNGCIIRSTLMEKLVNVQLDKKTIMETPWALEYLEQSEKSCKLMLNAFTDFNLPAPCFRSSIDYYFQVGSIYPTANMIQAQRDYFGAHTYERVDDESGKKYHTVWTQA